MTRTLEDLRHVLHELAEDTHAWPAPRLRERRTSRSRGAVVVTAVVAVVVALVALPAYLGLQRHPHQAPATRTIVRPSPLVSTWQAVDCPPQGGCAMPQAVEVNGRRFTRMSYGSAPLLLRGHRSGNGISMELQGRHDPRWVLVGAVRTGPASRLTVTFDRRPPRELTSSRLTWLRVPRGTREVSVDEHGTPPRREVTYVAQFSRQR